jgi:hypothetical protein
MGPVADYDDTLALDSQVLSKEVRECRMDRDDAIGGAKHVPLNESRNFRGDVATLLRLR